MSVEASCHCGAARLVVPHPPSTVTSCTCTLCHNFGHLSAYFSEAEVTLPAKEITQTYMHGDKDIVFHRCVNCGSQTHSVGRDMEKSGNDRMAINADLLPREVLAAARVRRFDGLDSWTTLDEDFKWAYCPLSSQVDATNEVKLS